MTTSSSRETASASAGGAKRWDSFTLVTPNWWTRLPGFPYEGDDPDGFLSRDEVVSYLDEYVERFDLPVRAGVEVTAVRSDGVDFVVETTDSTYEAANVVVATGAFQDPRILTFSADVPSSIHQLHSSEYTNPDALSDGAVLVVGSSQSGAQIASELHESGRDVYLSVSSAFKMPRRYRGQDMVGGWWPWARSRPRSTTSNRLPSGLARRRTSREKTEAKR